VIEAMRRTPHGIHQLVGALHDFHEGRPIRVVNEGGEVVRDGEGRPQNVNDTYLRREFPPPGSPRPLRPGETPTDRFHNAIQDFARAFENLERMFRGVQGVVGDDGYPLVEAKGVPEHDAEAWRGICREIGEELLIWYRTFRRLKGSATGSRDEWDDTSANWGQQ